MNNKSDFRCAKNAIQKFKEKKITHLYFNDRYLKKIPLLGNVQNLIVIYLHNNEIYEISNLHNAHKLSNLYLQKNRIIKIENLDNLKKLKKLYLGHNTLSVVEGLQNLQSLEELYLEKQFLPEGNCLCFDPRSICGIAHSLQILNISHNRIQTISSLAPLKFLKTLDASHNDISDMEEVCDVIKGWFCLKNLSLAQNPICKNRLYKENVIANAYCLETLDQKSISDHTTSFLKGLHKERVAHRLHKDINLAHKIPDLPRRYSSAIQKAVSISVLKQFKNLDDNNEIFDERNAVFVPWKTLPKPQKVVRLKSAKNNIKKSKRRQSPAIATAFQHLKI